MSIVKLNNRGVRSATSFGSASAIGSMVFIKKVTASSSATISFVHGTSDVVLDSTYKEYLFTLNNIHPQTNDENLSVNFRDGGSAYDATKTTTAFRAYHDEAGSTQAVAYVAGSDLAQSTAVQDISFNLGSDADQCCAGYLHLFNPSSTTFVKHFIIHTNTTHASDYTNEWHIAGYCNTTTAIDGVQFKMSSGDISTGDICLYGIN